MSKLNFTHLATSRIPVCCTPCSIQRTQLAALMARNFCCILSPGCLLIKYIYIYYIIYITYIYIYIYILLYIALNYTHHLNSLISPFDWFYPACLLFKSPKICWSNGQTDTALGQEKALQHLWPSEDLPKEKSWRLVGCSMAISGTWSYCKM